MDDTAKHPFWEEKNEGFAGFSAACDLLHPELTKPELGASLTETQYFGFNIPSESVYGLCYIWHHPNLKVVTGGAFAWQGTKPHNLSCELFDFITYMSDDCLKNDLWDYQLENSYHVRTLEPLRRHEISYSDPARQNSFQVAYEAIMPPMVLSTGLHLEQAMKTSGQVTLRGKTFTIDGYTVRDRSWGQMRPEGHKNFPPMAWMTGVCDQSFIFGCTAFDTPQISPDTYPGLEIPGGQNTKGGWVYQNGALTPIISARKRTTRNRLTLFPETVELDMTDVNGRLYALKGTITVAANWKTWHNFDSIICLIRWEFDGMTFYGDFQECHWIDFVRLAKMKSGDPVGPS
jgi:hypothetical protein